MSFSPYPEYKDSGLEWVGEVPSDWESWKIAHAFKRIGSGTTPPSTEGKWYEDGEIPWITTGELRENVVTYTKKSVTREALRAFPALRLHSKGALAMAMYGATIGRLGILGVEATTNQACSVMESSTDLAVKFVFYWLHCNRTTIVALFSTGGGQPNINQEAVTSLRIPAPTLTVQTHIARFLDHETAKIDALIREQERLIELLQEKRQAVISHAVTKGLDPDVPMKDSGVEWLGEVPAHWDVMRMRFVCRITTGDKDTQDAKADGQYPFFVRSETIEKSDTYSFDGEGVFTSGDGAGVGKIFHHFRGKCAIHQRVYLFHSFHKISSTFFYHFLRSKLEPVVLSQSAKSTVDSLRLPMLQNFWMTSPPHEDQELICNYINSFESQTLSLLEECSSSIKLLKERRSALISAAVTGKIDVRNWQPPVDESAFDEEVRQAGMETTA